MALAQNKVGPPERMLPAVSSVPMDWSPALNLLALPGSRLGRPNASGTTAATAEASSYDAPDARSPPRLLPDPPALNALVLAARPNDAPQPPAIPLESFQRPPPQAVSLRQLARADTTRTEHLTNDCAAGPPPAVPRLAGSTPPNAAPLSSGMPAKDMRLPAGAAAASAVAAAARAEVVSNAVAARAELPQSGPVETAAAPMMPKSFSCTLPIGPSTSTVPTRKAPASPVPWNEAELGTSADESFGASGFAHNASWQAARSPGDPGSLFSCISTAVSAEKSRSSTPRREKMMMTNQLPDKFRADLEHVTPLQNHVAERGLKVSHDYEIYSRHRSRSASPNPSFTPMGLQMVQSWQPVAASTMPPATAAIAVTMPSTWCTPWIPPPLPPVPCELTRRIAALEKDMQESGDAENEQSRVGQSTLEQSVETLRRQLSVLEANAVHSNVLEAELAQCKVDWTQQVAKLEASVATSKITSEEKADLNACTQLSQQQTLLSEVQRLSQELQAVREERDQERRSRQQFEQRHQDAFVENKRLYNDVCKLRDEHAAELQARQEWEQKHQAVEADASILREDIKKLQAAKEAELHSTHSEWQCRHKTVEELSQKLEADLRQLKADLEAEKHARSELQKAYDALAADAEQLHRDQEALAENKRLNNDITKLRNDHDSEKKARQAAEQRHREAIAETKRVEQDFRKLQGDHSAEQQARKNAEEKHQAVEADAANLREDFKRLQAAKDAELHSTQADWQQRHKTVEELSQKLQMDLRQLETDLQGEKLARKELQKEYDAVSHDVDHLRSDILRLQAARDAEQRAREDAERKHRLLEADREHIRADLLQLQAAHDTECRAHHEVEGRHSAAEMELERTRTDLHHKQQLVRDAELRHSAVDSEVSRLRAALEQAQEVASRTARDLATAELRTRELTAERDSERSLAASQSSTLEEQRALLQKARQAEGALWTAEEKVRTYEVRLSGTQNEVEELRKRLFSAEAERDQLSFDNTTLQRTKEQREEMEQTLRVNLDAVRAQLLEMEGSRDLERQNASVLEQRLAKLLAEREKSAAERDQLQNDKTHLMKANRQREEAEHTLKTQLEDEQNLARELRSQLEAVQAKLKMSQTEGEKRVSVLQAQREESESHLRNSLADERNTAREIRSQLENLTELKKKLNMVESERGQLQSDNVHLQRAKDQREESEASLRRGLEEERSTSVNLRSELEHTQAELKTVKDESELKLSELRAQLETTNHEHREARKSYAESELKVSELRVQLETSDFEHQETRKSYTGSSEALVNLQQNLSTLEAERDQLQSDNVHLKRAREQREESQASLRQGIEDERGLLSNLKIELEHTQAELKRVTNESELKVSELKIQLETSDLEHQEARKSYSGSSEALVSLREKLALLEAERDQLQSNNLHLVRVKEQREESEASLNRALEEERNISQNLRTEVGIMEAKLKKGIDEVRSQMLTGSEDVTSETFAEMQKRLALLQVERDRLQSDCVHLKRAKEEREEAEAGLRRGLLEERKTNQNLMSQLENMEAELESMEAQADLKALDKRLDAVVPQELVPGVSETAKTSAQSPRLEWSVEDDTRLESKTAEDARPALTRTTDRFRWGAERSESVNRLSTSSTDSRPEQSPRSSAASDNMSLQGAATRFSVDLHQLGMSSPSAPLRPQQQIIEVDLNSNEELSDGVPTSPSSGFPVVVDLDELAHRGQPQDSDYKVDLEALAEKEEQNSSTPETWNVHGDSSTRTIQVDLSADHLLEDSY